jgi:hypothetical protein
LYFVQWVFSRLYTVTKKLSGVFVPRFRAPLQWGEVAGAKPQFQRRVEDGLCSMNDLESATVAGGMG